jgi:hypothetical protein
VVEEYNVIGGLRQDVFARPVPEHGCRRDSSGESSATSGESSARAQRRVVRGRRELSEERQELGDEQRELDDEQRELGESSATSGESSARAQRRVVRGRRELGEESLAWPETWLSSESSVTILTRSDKSSVKILQYKYVER